MTHIYFLAYGTVAQDTVYRSNYGTVFEPIMTLNPTNEYWTHTVKIELPVIPRLPGATKVLMGCMSQKPVNTDCETLHDTVENLMMLRDNMTQMLYEITDSVKDIIPELRITDGMSRSKKAILQPIGDFIGNIFGLATETDFDNLATHIIALENRTASAGSAFAAQTERLTSFMHSTDGRISNAVEAIKLNHHYVDQMANTVLTEFHHSIELLASITKLLIDYVKHAGIIQMQIESLLSGINHLMHGKLTTGILPAPTCKSILLQIADRLSQHSADMQLASNNIEEIYQITSALLTRRGNNLYLHLKFPLNASVLGRAIVYKVTTFPMPVPNNPTKATQLLEYPKFIALTINQQYYAYMNTEDLLSCKGDRLQMCSKHMIFQTTSKTSCILSLLLGTAAETKQLCNFRLLMEEPAPYMMRLSNGQLIVSGSSDLSVQCRTGGRILPGCLHCIYNIPCFCSVHTRDIYIPPSIGQCTQSITATSQLHPVNLAVLQQFFDETLLTNITAQTSYTMPLPITIPQIKTYQQNFSDILAIDQTQHFSLERIAQITKNDEPIFQSLAEPILSGRLLLKHHSYLTATDIIAYVALALSVVTMTGILYLTYKLHRVAGMMAILAQLNNPVTATTLPSLVFAAKPTFPAASIDPVLTPDSYTIAMIFIAVGITLHYLKSKCKPTHATMLQLELTNGADCVMIPLQALPFCPEHWQFMSHDTPSGITIIGYCRPKLLLNWHHMKIVNTFSGQVFHPTDTFSLSFRMAHKARRILSNQYNAYFSLLHQGRIFHFGVDNMVQSPSSQSVQLLPNTSPC